MATNEVSQRTAEHYNKLEEKGLEERTRSRIFHQRNLNNFIKSALIAEIIERTKNYFPSAPISVLDIACGRGGDLLKWKKAGISHLVCADIADESLKICQSRFEEMKERSGRFPEPMFTAEFIAADCTATRLTTLYAKKDLQKFHICSCQFALHYSFDSYQRAKVMLTNITESLLPGGYFIATIPNANHIVRRLRESVNGREFGSKVFSITTDADTKHFPLFGAKYHFKLDDQVNCPEYLVNFPLLVKMMEEMGLELLFSCRFPAFLQRCLNENRGLLGKMQALEPFPAVGDTPLVGEPDEYQHAKDYLSASKDDKGTIGTLSKSEWDVFSVYMVCAFRKYPENPA